jgi:hypothetical protein
MLLMLRCVISYSQYRNPVALWWCRSAKESAVLLALAEAGGPITPNSFCSNLGSNHLVLSRLRDVLNVEIETFWCISLTIWDATSSAS